MASTSRPDPRRQPRRARFAWLFAPVCALQLGLSPSVVEAASPQVAPAPVFVDCRGPRSAAPTIVLEAGAFGTSADWDRVQRILAPRLRVCAYDRAGLGRSAPRQDHPDAETIARDLAKLLDELGEHAPVILAGHSNGGVYAEAFAKLFPDRTAGLLYLDAVGSDDLDNETVMTELREEEARARLAVHGATLGLAPLFVGHMISAIGLRGRAATHKWAALTSLHHLRASRREVLEIIPSLARLRALGPVRSTIPIAVIVAAQRPDEDRDRAWRAAQVIPAKRACRGWVLDANGASHVSPLGRDRIYVVAAVDWLVAEARREPSDSCTPESYRQ